MFPPVRFAAPNVRDIILKSRTAGGERRRGAVPTVAEIAQAQRTQRREELRKDAAGRTFADLREKGINTWLGHLRGLIVARVALGYGKSEDAAVAMWDTLRQLFLQAFVLLILSLLAVDRSDQHYPTANALKRAFTDGEFLYVPKEGLPEPAVPVYLRLVNITSANMFWDYMGAHFIPVFSLKGDDKPSILQVNYFLGTARMRQLRTTNNSCKLEKELEEYISGCYGFYKAGEAETAAFGLANGPEWWYKTGEEAGYSSRSGHFGPYDGGGYFVDLPKNYNKSMKIIRHLERNDWVDRRTRAVYVDACLHTAYMNNYWMITLLFEFSPIGRVLASTHVSTIRYLNATQTYTYILIAFRLCYLICTLWHTIIEGLHMMVYGRQYVHKLSNLVYCMYLMLAWAFIRFDWSYLTIRPRNILYDDSEHYCPALQKWSDTYTSTHQTGALALFLHFLLFFQFLDYGGSSPLTQTLLKSLSNIIVFSVMFLMTLFVFAVVSYMQFGYKLKGMRNLHHAFFTLCNAVLGSFDVKGLVDVSMTFAPIFFIIFTFLIVFVLCNLFTVILNDTYLDVRTSGKAARSEFTFRGFLIQGLKNMMRRGRLRQGVIKPPPHGLSYMSVRSLFHFAWVHWPEMKRFFLRDRIKRAVMANRLDEESVADVPLLRFGNVKQAYMEDLDRILKRLDVIQGNIDVADDFLAPLISEDAQMRQLRQLRNRATDDVHIQ